MTPFLRLAVVLCVIASTLMAGGHAGAAAPAPVRHEVLTGLPSARPDGSGTLYAGQTLTSSVPVNAPLPFSMVGLAVPDGAEAWVRVSDDGRLWGPWQPAEPEPDEGPDPGSAEAARANERAQKAGGRWMSAPLWVSSARHVQTRVAGAVPEAVNVHLIDSVGLSRSLPERLVDAVKAAVWSTPREAQADTAQPAIVSRAEWGADESLVGQPPAYAAAVRNAFVHHTVSSNGYSAAEAPGVVRGIQRYHAEGRGWSDIGYNFLIDRFGTIYEGRIGGIEEAVIGAQAGGFNTGSTGVSLIGDLSSTPAPQAAVDSLIDVLAWKMDVHHADVLSELVVTSLGSSRYPEGVDVPLHAISGHRDVSSTTCPGSIYDLLPDLRKAIADEQGPVLVAPADTPDQVRVAAGRNLDGPVQLGARLRPAGPWQIEVRDPAGQVVHRAEGSGEEAGTVWDAAESLRGDYTWSVTSEGRRPIAETIALVAPEVTDAAAVPPAVVVDDDGAISDTVVIGATLWEGAEWNAKLRDADGQIVARERGVGETVRLEWNGPATTRGTYTWTVQADDVDPVSGEVIVTDSVVRRVGVEDGPAAASVALSRAAFPESASARVAVLAREDIFADAMAAGPLAGVEGPLLLTAGDELDRQVARELDRVLGETATVYVVGGTAALSPAVVDALGEVEVVRLAGAERTETAARVAEQVLDRSGSRVALLARARPDEEKPWADALAGGAWGARAGVPVLLTDRDTLSAPAAAVLEGLDATIVLGGTAAVADTVLAEVPNARRVAGADRTATAVAVARELWGRTSAAPGERVLFGDAYDDEAWTLALAATPLAARLNAPLLVATPEGLPQATADYLEGLGYTPATAAQGFALGGAERVGDTGIAEASELLR